MQSGDYLSPSAAKDIYIVIDFVTTISSDTKDDRLLLMIERDAQKRVSLNLHFASK